MLDPCDEYLVHSVRQNDLRSFRGTADGISACGMPVLSVLRSGRQRTISVRVLWIGRCMNVGSKINEEEAKEPIA